MRPEEVAQRPGSASAPSRYCSTSSCACRLAPGEVGVRSARSRPWRDAIHHLGAGERLGEEHRVRVARADRRRSSTARTAAAWCAGCRRGTGFDALLGIQNITTSRSASHSPGTAPDAVEIDVDDVLVFLRRVLGVFESSRPGRQSNQSLCSLQPGMVWRALDGEIDRNLQAMRQPQLQPSARKSSKRTQLRMQGIMPPIARSRLRRALPGIAFHRAGESVVRPLAVGAADRAGLAGNIARRKPMSRIARQMALDVSERAMAGRRRRSSTAGTPHTTRRSRRRVRSASIRHRVRQRGGAGPRHRPLPLTG